MTSQFLITMRRHFARAFAKDRSVLDVTTLLANTSSAKLIGASGYSMRVQLDEAELPKLKSALGDDFSIQPDYAMETFAAKRR